MLSDDESWTNDWITPYGYVPNSMRGASIRFGNGQYADNSLIVQVTDHTLRLGVRKTAYIPSDWTIFDSFRLHYLGTLTPPNVNGMIPVDINRDGQATVSDVTRLLDILLKKRD